MKCPKCKDRTEVLQTRQRGSTISRRRRCLSPLCGVRVTTTEHIGRHSFAPIEDEVAIRARAISRELSSSRMDKDVMAAIIATDIRRGKIARSSLESHRRESGTWYDSGFDPAPSHLDRDSLSRELGD